MAKRRFKDIYKPYYNLIKELQDKLEDYMIKYSTNKSYEEFFESDFKAHRRNTKRHTMYEEDAIIIIEGGIGNKIPLKILEKVPEKSKISVIFEMQKYTDLLINLNKRIESLMK